MNQLFHQRREKLFLLQTLRKVGFGRSAQGKEEREPAVSCPACGAQTAPAELKANLYVCPACGHHHPLRAWRRLELVFDPGSARELERGLKGKNPLNFPGYPAKLAEARQKTGLTEACVAAVGTIDGRPAAAAVLDGRFLMGSMGWAVGEKITRITEYAERKKLALIIFSASGGARMQEGICSLMQMAKTSAALARFSEKGGLYISYLTDPTTGGVSASFAGLGDITLAEPGALIGFAGPRVIRQIIGEELPEGFQRAEYLEEHGFVDRIVPRSEARKTLSLILRLHDKRR